MGKTSLMEGFFLFKVLSSPLSGTGSQALQLMLERKEKTKQEQTAEKPAAAGHVVTVVKKSWSSFMDQLHG
ncbi:hypothetical protein U0070_015664 [Myodes glareolus]|uniref:Uncharacterized protein n=1 Tax=Myodes glareolus TaxID=447135 RepID=A0AAW0HAF1_MYOGA